MRNLMVFGVLLVLSPTGAQAQIPTAERDALIALYNSTNGSGWVDNDNWLGGPGTECTWDRVICHPGGTGVKELWMYGNNLIGEIPPDLGDLSNIEYLLLDNNQLTGEIPPELGNLTNLLHLFLFNNQLVGEIPPELGNLSSLEKLHLFNNHLVGEIPAELGGLSNLESLNLNSNELAGTIPVELGNLGNLQELILDSNHLIGGVPPELGSLASLRRLNLSDNNLTGTIPIQLSSLSLLRLLVLSDNELDGVIPPEIGAMSALRQIDLARNRLGGSIPAELGSLDFLERLYVESNQFTGQVPDEIELTALANSDGLDLRWNGLFNTDPDLSVFLFAKQIGDIWETSQTNAPTGERALRVGDHTIELGWDPVTVLASYDGGFETYSVPTSGGTWTAAGRTPSKSVVAMPITGLDPGTSYDVAVATFTSPHPDNKNEVLSERGPSVTETTTNTGCTAPVITLNWTLAGAELTVDQVGTYDWSTGETTQSITVNPPGPEHFWVWVTIGSCTEAAITLVEPGLFFDGFESGDTSGWTATSP